MPKAGGGGYRGGVSAFKGTEFQFGKVTDRELDDGESHTARGMCLVLPSRTLKPGKNSMFYVIFITIKKMFFNHVKFNKNVHKKKNLNPQRCACLSMGSG